jgi:hypothetical protein
MPLKHVYLIVIFVIVLVALVWFHDHQHDCQKKHILKQKTKHEKTIGLLPVLDPIFNLRQICKQCVLLEDHLSIPRMNCRDCIMKHFLYLEGYAEEAITLDKDSKYLYILEKLPDHIRRLQDMFNSDEEYHIIAQELRKLRKSLIHKCFNLGALGTKKDGSLPPNARTCGGAKTPAPLVASSTPDCGPPLNLTFNDHVHVFQPKPNTSSNSLFSKVNPNPPGAIHEDVQYQKIYPEYVKML